MIDRLKKVGFTDNESKVYLELLKGFPSTAYQIAKRTGLAGANVYQVLATLVQKGRVVSTEGDKKLYTPIDPTKWLKGLKKDFISNHDEITKELTSLYENKDEDYLIYRLRNKDAILNKITELIASAKTEIYFDFFPKHFETFKDKIIQAADNGIITKGIVYKEYDIIGENIFFTLNPKAEFVLNRYENDLFTLLIDAKQVIFGSFSKDGSVISSYWSQDQHLCIMIESGMRSEMIWWFLLKNVEYEKYFNEEQKKFYDVISLSRAFEGINKRNNH